MSSAPPFVIINKPGEEALRWAVQQLEKTGLRAVRTFDLREAWSAHSDCPCLHHGTEACDCQMIVLLVYQGELAPASLLLHSFLKSTWFYLVDTPVQPLDPGLEVLIQETLHQPSPVVHESENLGDTHARA
jgi:hypothetical protein